ncbi:hypothetical protein UB37_17000 [Photobacterium iliopiscarium]|uniref:Uncharacterized protein n=1 Tax=Photobacterium iliopiscarium TaxID=56192 RepID=A0ABX5GTS3_9GAMM|nr:hypothetical protein [Photobacterium iliopiscarium]KJG19678.1 hypothetical protein UB37_17000 [Photobacterium iliopiscarium]PSW98209.1 hypothetical protein C9J52_08445 [Photobacterium iliopiscarium]
MALSNTAQTNASQQGIAVTTTGSHSPVTIIQAIPQMTSLLTPLFDRLIEVYQPYYVEESDSNLSSETEDKIKFNSLNILANDIRDLAGFLTVIETAIDEIDSQNPGSSKKFLWAINQKYKAVKKQVLIEHKIDARNSIEIHKCISDNSDKILTQVTDSLFESVTLSVICDIDTLKATELLVSCYGFVNCKILEKPSDY